MMLQLQKWGCAIGLILSCWLLTLQTAQASSLAGLATLRSLAREAIPYTEALANGKPTVIEFYADWCTTCQGLAKTMQAIEQDYGDRVNFVMLNIDEPQWAPQIAANQVTGVPQLTFLDRQHQVQRQVVGAVPQAILAQMMVQLEDS
ncbi:MAG: thioredoxin fold domain-containing protein [Spirulina sp. SIO3F2]|nr:thioredoxin fold domain-containing protein [Spirulina sp. SIO3F2]